MSHIQISGLSKQEDAYGNNIYDTYFNLGGGYDIIEREDGHFTLNGDSNAYTEAYGHWTSIQKAAAALVSGKTLDIGCGGGKHSIHFQNQGIDIWGMDNSPLGLEVCKARGLKQSILCDIAHLDRKVIQDLDTVFLWGNNMGLLQNENLARRFFKEALHFCKPAAKIMIETLNPYGKAFDYDDDKQYIQTNLADARLGGQIRVRVRYRFFVTPWKDYLFVSKEELNHILEGTGWALSHCFDDNEIDQYIAVIEREES